MLIDGTRFWPRDFVVVALFLVPKNNRYFSTPSEVKSPGLESKSTISIRLMRIKMANKQHQKLAMILVGDHLGQLKKIIPTSDEILVIPDCAQSTSSNPVTSIEPFPSLQTNQLISYLDGQLYQYDAITNETKSLSLGLDGSLIRALPMHQKRGILAIYEQQITHHKFNSKNDLFVKMKLKTAKIKNSKLNSSGDRLAIVGQEIPLIVYDTSNKKQIFKADRPEKDWLGIHPDCYVSNLDFVGGHRIATCSRSDSVIRIYDINRDKNKPVITVNLDQIASNEHADSAKFHTVASTGDDGHSIVVGSNVGQILAIDLRFNVKDQPSKRKMKPRLFKVLGGFKGQRGASVKDIKIVPDNDGIEETESSNKFKVITCSLDRYLRIHDFSKKSRELNKHFYMTTKPYCCSPIYYE